MCPWRGQKTVIDYLPRADRSDEARLGGDLGLFAPPLWPVACVLIHSVLRPSTGFRYMITIRPVIRCITVYITSITELIVAAKLFGPWASQA